MPAPPPKPGVRSPSRRWSRTPRHISGRAWAMICRENTSSKPTSLAKAVSTAGSSANDSAGSGRPRRRVPKQRHGPFGVGCAAAVPEGKQAGHLAAKPPRHGLGRGAQAFPAALEGRRSQAALVPPSWPRPTRPGRPGGRRVALVRIDEGVQEAGRVAAHDGRSPRRHWPRRRGPATRSPGVDGVDQAHVDHLGRPGDNTVATSAEWRA